MVNSYARLTTISLGIILVLGLSGCGGGGGGGGAGPPSGPSGDVTVVDTRLVQSSPLAGVCNLHGTAVNNGPTGVILLFFNAFDAGGIIIGFAEAGLGSVPSGGQVRFASPFLSHVSGFIRSCSQIARFELTQVIR